MVGASSRIRFKAYGPDGTVETGAIEARDEADAVRQLRRTGRVPFELRPEAGAPGTGGAGGQIAGAATFGARLDLARFFGDLAVMLGAGFTIDTAIRAIADAETDRVQATRAADIHRRITEGLTAAEAFAALPEIGPDVAALVASGESSGRIDVVVANLAADYAEARARRQKLQEALAYPAFLILVMVAAFALLAFYLAPALEPIFVNVGVPVPTILGALLAAGEIARVWGLPLALALALATAAGLLSLRTPSGRARAAELLLRVPVAAAFLRGAATARYLRTLALLLGNGVPMLEAMALATGTVAAQSQRRALMAARQDVADGAPVWRALENSHLFPDFVVSLVRLGEQSNNLGLMLGRAGAVIEARIERRVTRLLTFLTPAITLLLGLVIGGMVVSVMTTLLSVNELTIR